MQPPMSSSLPEQRSHYWRGPSRTFVVCQALIPGSFVLSGGEAARTWMELLFLSVAVLSSVGLSDILPATPMARAIIALESFVGVMYIALVVSRLIAMSTHKKEQA